MDSRSFLHPSLSFGDLENRDAELETLWAAPGKISRWVQAKCTDPKSTDGQPVVKGLTSIPVFGDLKNRESSPRHVKHDSFDTNLCFFSFHIY